MSRLYSKTQKVLKSCKNERAGLLENLFPNVSEDYDVVNNSRVTEAQLKLMRRVSAVKELKSGSRS